ncbi:MULTISPECIES: hypothetical protein [unclassified Streptomyces]|uniref:hypothetical protein n=1 Tax=unclassified Streptomyces TaxID=2593676 RepID=UPI001CD0E808|nr:hypothetical protein [Streptomyces sp. PSKA30]
MGQVAALAADLVEEPVQIAGAQAEVGEGQASRAAGHIGFRRGGVLWDGGPGSPCRRCAW